MKRIGIILVCGLAMALSGWSQVLTPAGPALPPSGPPPAMALDGSLLSPGAVLVPPSPINNAIITTVETNQPVAPVNIADLASVLLNLRFVIDRALPRLAAYNGAVQSGNSGTNLDNSVVSNVVAVGSTGVNLGANLSQNVSAASGANLSANMSSVVGAAPATGVSGTGAPANTTANVNVSPPNSSSGLTTQETVSALQVLQEDLAQAQTILNALSVGQGVAAPVPSTGP